MNMFKIKDIDPKVKKFFFFAVILIGLSAFWLSFLPLDPDFGWHLKTGELIYQNKTIPRIDWYSFSMSDFPWVNHEWLADYLIFLVYDKIGGYLSLILLFFLFGVLSVYLSVEKCKIEHCALPVLFAFLCLVPYGGVRFQILAWFFVSLIVKIFFDPAWVNKRKISFYFLPPLFILWANVHGSFIFGLLIFAFAILMRIVAQKKVKAVYQMSLIFLISFLGTFINPYGYRVYEEIFRSANDPFLRQNILEWQSFFSIMYWPSIFYFAFFVVLALLFYKKVPFERLALSIIVLVMSVLSTRHFPLFIIVSLPVIVQFSEEFSKAINKERLKRMKPALFAMAVFILLLSIFYRTYPFSYNKTDYPDERMVAFLRGQETRRAFNYYGWGGFLIQNFPERRFFIDGRMPSWRHKGLFALGDYVSLTSGKNVDEIIDRYKIDQFILPLQPFGTDFLLEDYLDYMPATIGRRIWHEEETSFDLVEYLSKESEWRKVYEDDIAVIFEKRL